MRNNLRQLPDLTFSRTLAGVLRGWDLTIERNEEEHLWQSIRALFLSVSATIFCENCVTNVDMHGRFAGWIKWRACDVGEAKEGLENELWRMWSNGRVGEWAVTYIKRRKGWRMSCDVGEVTERLENEQSAAHLRHNSFSNHSVALPLSQLIFQPFRCFTYVTAHSPILLSLLLRHRLFT